MILYHGSNVVVEQTIQSLMPQNLKDQYAFKTQDAIDLLKFTEVVEA